MKMLGLALAAVTVLTLAPATAFAHKEGKVDSILFTCNMAFRATGKSIYIGLGWSNIKGKGTISCYDLVHGTTEILPIKIRVKGPGAGIGVTGLVLSGAVAGIGVERGPQDLIGRYVAVRGNAAVGVGVGGSVGLRVSKGGITIPLSVQGQAGLGVGVDLLSLKVESDGDSRIEQGPPPVVGRPAPQAAPAAATSVKAEAEAEAQAQAQVQTSDDDDGDEVSAQAEASATARAEVVSAPAPAPATAPATVPAPSKAAPTSTKSNVVYLKEGQPLQILDAKGHVIQTIYLQQK